MTHANGAPSARSGMALNVERTIGLDASCTHIPFPFTVDRESEGMEISFSYDPKVLMDERRARDLIEAGMRAYADSLEAGGPDHWRSHAPLTNLLTLSLDSPTGFRGCAHRQSNRQSITIGRGTATPGFIPGTVEPGLWKATISVHLVVTEQCTFRLQIRVP
ncbi:MAG: hypothetical protein ABSF77_16580 [Spirochaetia bacterium]|jgi:hypothetical protein